MNLREFNGLSEAGKQDVLALWGDLLYENVVPGYRVMVYKVANFFVEAYVDTKAQVTRRYRGCIRAENAYL
jgi:hypothetical protein